MRENERVEFANILRVLRPVLVLVSRYWQQVESTSLLCLSHHLACIHLAEKQLPMD